MPSSDKPWPADVGPNSDQLARYAAEERAKLERQPGDAIEEWTVTDHWWTDNPITFEYRRIERDGQKVTQRRFEGGDSGPEWRDYDPVPKEHDREQS